LSSLSSHLLSIDTMGDATDDTKEKLILYTNHGCPWAHRAHIILKELGLAYEETIIDLERPREEWYLKINDVCSRSPMPRDEP